MSLILEHYLYGFGVGIAFFIIAWVVSLVLGKSSHIDSVWGLSFSLLTAFYYYLSGKVIGQLDIIFITVVFLWSFRLGLFLAYRFSVEGEDRRYVEIKTNWNKTNVGFIGMFILQGFLASLLSIPLLLFSHGVVVNEALFFVGISFVFIFTVFETVADWQLFQFKARNKNRTCNVGLWKYSRHPNYFSEWMIWVGLFLTTLSQGALGWFSFISVAIIFYLLNFVSGIPIIERDARNGVFKREGEKEYFESTSVFFPLLPRRKS
ncbi:DUF1295 domain-containing protein [Bacteriovorax sp. Seq25_V]|uniref:DUF1295 domain-containing protein n=1 Tax=Bacteriovorax sp. Seq25_V TaxID=1201288 RepID=UPI00038A0A1A|nr:DUF1295 domain-containing protein [Bacteriovorax sp. Seq25_V]EQC46099.1 PF06966 family protein [Bacteriovorax sp. Seq25_V]